MIKSLSELITEHFYEVWGATHSPDILNIVAPGGRGSGKSSNLSIIVTQLVMSKPVNAVVIRKTDNTLATSVYEQIKWAISEQGVGHLWKFTKSPMEAIYLPRGNKIIFRGAQNPERLKSLKDSQFPYAIAWIEELAEFKTEDEVTTITNSILRGKLPEGVQYKFFFSYNPPKRKRHWTNKKYSVSGRAKNTLVHRSTYLDNPHLAPAFIEEAKATQERNENRYRWEYLGEPIGSGVVPFDNLQFRKINDDEMLNFDNFRNGIDFGLNINGPFIQRCV